MSNSNTTYSLSTNQKCYLIFKRVIDIFGSLIGIGFCFVLFWWWVFIINFIITKGRPVFCHSRYGKGDILFKLIKFRSMKTFVNPNASSYSKHTKNEYSLFGNFLRKTSIDETLQLFNILMGQMSFIGPRPLCDNDEDRITLDSRRLHGVNLIKPGLSGLAQVKGRTDLSPIIKADIDFEYLQIFNFWVDFKIFIYSLFGIRIKDVQ